MSPRYSWKKWMLLTALIAPVITAWSSLALAQDADCLRRLAQGKNRFGEPLPFAALRKMTIAKEKSRSQLSQDRFALLIDYSRNSRDRRAFLIDFAACDVVAAENVIHGGSIYRPETHWGDPNQDGQLDHCAHVNGSQKYMTRPGAFVTAGCHQTRLTGWTHLSRNCQGIKLVGMDSYNSDAFEKGIVLHEHVEIPNDATVKPTGQGCPAFPMGRLKNLLRYGLMEGTILYVHAPQCFKSKASSIGQTERHPEKRAIPVGESLTPVTDEQRFYERRVRAVR